MTPKSFKTEDTVAKHLKLLSDENLVWQKYNKLFLSRMNFHLKSSIMEIKAWYIFYTYPRAERKAHQWLMERAYEVFLPLNEKVHFWNNRQRKIISYPIFPGYIFVRIPPSRIYFVLQNPKIVKCITFGTIPSILCDKDIFLIRKMIEPGNNMSVEKNSPIGSRVKINYGPFKGYEGVITNNRVNTGVRIQLNSIPYAISVDIEEKEIEVVD